MFRCIVFILVALFGSLIASPSKNSINAVLGDASFIATFGSTPGADAGEQLRIETHLVYVETLLRDKNTNHLSPELVKKRMHLLDLLHEYRLAGEFPKNYDYQERRPCFIDRDGNICAVGYLVAETAGIEAARQINSRYQYARIYDMDSPELVEWVTQSGLTLEECAMIQPEYCYCEREQKDYIETSLGISTALLSGVNLSMIAVNSVQLSQHPDSKRAAVVGFFSGTAQLLLGIAAFPRDDGIYLNESHKNVALLNIGFATSTILLSTFNLIANRKYRKKKPLAWNVYGYSSESRQPGLGLSLVKRF